MRRRLAVLLAAFPLALPVTAGEAVADAALVPVPFTGAGFTLPPGPLFSSFEGEEDEDPISLTAPVTAVAEVGVCAKSGGGPFPVPPGVVCSREVQVTSFANGAVALATPRFQLQATLASSAGSPWQVELVDPILAVTDPGAPGTPIDGATTVLVRVVIDAFPSATFEVPDATAAPVEAIGFRRAPPNRDGLVALPLLEARSAMLDTAVRPFVPGLVESFLDDDEITLVGRVRYELVFEAVVFASQVVGVQFQLVDPCGSVTSPTALPDRACSVGLALSAAHTATPTASLACRADLTEDGVVNFADLARLRSVFFQTCTP